eukprot:CAMPEP_0185848208 /NCGR_PEP_ID=MMETSP1354-20130828/3179_1 /TAXON_ID=708628 /ORGANISM="Erythrolobus madagascarensis, Strain CCMP3276" /LENGTH=326 /DNA_ID=CAMNT_0028548581 /DNA_START=6 /DNA_END=986 /DNA_ORIENTATION=-
MVAGFVSGFGVGSAGSLASAERCVRGQAGWSVAGSRRARVVEQRAGAVSMMATTPSTLEAITSAGCFSTFMKCVGIIKEAGLMGALPSNCTFLLPTDAAFARLRPGTIEALAKKPEILHDILRYHVVTSGAFKLDDLKGTGYLAPLHGEEMPYVALKGVVKFGNAMAIPESSDIACSAGYIHALDTVIVPPHVKPAGIDAGYVAPSLTPKVVMSTPDRIRAVGATLPKAISGRKAMNLIKQQPFWMYGPPYNAATQEDYEPISIAAPTASVDYQLMPPGSVVTVPDSYNAGELNPVSGMSKYIGQTKKLVGDQGTSKYAEILEEGM